MVPAVDPAHDVLGPAGLVHPRAHIEVGVVVEDPHLRAHLGGFAEPGPLLGEALGGLGLLPDRLPQAAVQADGHMDPQGQEGFGGILDRREGEP